MGRPRRCWLLVAAALAVVCQACPAGAAPAAKAALPNIEPAAPDPWDTARVAVRSFTDRDGLPQNTVRGLAFDADGRLWVGTQDGLVVNDGRAWRPVSLPEGARFVHCLVPARDGGMYVGTLEGGLLEIEPGGAISHLGVDDGLPGDEVYWVLETASDLWVATDGGVARRQGAGFRAYRKADGLPSGTVYALVTTRDENGVETVWAGTYGGLARLQGAAWIKVDVPGMPGPVTALRATQGPDGGPALWVGTIHGACLLEGGQCTERFDSRSGLFDDQVDAFAESTMPDGSRAVWVGTERGGVVRLSPGAPSMHVDEAHGLPAGATRVLLAAPSKGPTSTVWVGLDYGGLAEIELGTWRAIDAANALPKPAVNSLLESRSATGKSTYWIGTQGGLTRLGPRGWTDAGLTTHPVLALLQSARDGAIWAGVDGGVARMAASGTTWWRDKDGLLSGAGITSLLESEGATGDELMWVGEQEGLALIEGGRVARTWTSKDGLPSEFVLTLAQTVAPGGHRTLWVGTAAGLASLDESTLAIVPHPFGEGPADRFIMSLLAETHGGATTLWAGTRAGPWQTRLDDGAPGEWVPLPEDVKRKLPNLVMNGLVRDGAARLYLFTNHGVARLDDPEGSTVTVFTVEDGLPSGECDTGGTLVDSRGRIWAGTAGGAAIFDPRDEVLDQTPKPLLLEQGARYAGRALDWDRASVRFEYALASFFKGGATRYRTQLVGWEATPTDWSENARREYSNLPSGRYDFEIWGRDGAGNVTGPVSTPFEVRVAPWRTWWAYGAYLVIVGGLGISIVRLREQALRAKNAALETSVASRTREIAERNAELDRNLGELRRLNAELVASQVQADRIFSALAEALPGTVLDGKYRLEARIGAGGFGAVFQATHLALKRPIAVKVFKPSPGNDSAQAVERFRREGQTTSLLTHPNAVRVLDAGVSEEGIAYLVMELLVGQTLADELHEVGKMPLERTWHVLEAVCDVLAEAHQLGIVHRDVKPSNIFLHRQDGAEFVKVVDFGIAKLLGETSTEDAAPKLTMTGGFVGTPVYMAPERLMNRPYGAESDVYSVGVVCFQMLTGETPFQQSAQNLLSLVWAHVHEEPPSLHVLRPDLPPEIDAVVRRALASDPAARPTMQELASRFAEAGGFARAAPRPARASASVAPVAGAPFGPAAGGPLASTAEAPVVAWPGAETRRGSPRSR